jgi:hypothetical protein
VVQMRQRYPDWGARKLQVLLAREKVELTGSTIHRVLLRHGLVRDQDRLCFSVRICDSGVLKRTAQTNLSHIKLCRM